MKYVEIQYLSPIEVRIRFRGSANVPDQESQSLAAGRSIFLLGTAHVSEQSTRQTEEKIADLKPDCICVELDRQRYENLHQKERWQNLDLFRMLKDGKGFLLLVNLLLASFQKRVGRDLAIKPGQEMLRAVELAEEQQVHLELVDRPVEVTLKRAWASCNFWQRAKLLNGLLASLFNYEKITEEDIEDLKEANTLEHLMDEFAQYLPRIKDSLIDERDVFLARSIASAPGRNVFAVLGAGHLRGVCQVLERVFSEDAQTEVKIDYTAATARANQTKQSEAPEMQTTEPQSDTAGTNLSTAALGTATEARVPEQQPEWFKNPAHPIPQISQLLTMPGKSAVSRFLPWLIPLLAVAILAAGFVFADTQKALQGLGIWALSHSVLAGLAALLVLAHPLSILVAILASPFTALNPTISVGLVTALSEVLLRKPRVKDAEELLELEKWWQFRSNRIWHALVIFVVVSLGGAAATFIALPWLSVLFSSLPG